MKNVFHDPASQIASVVIAVGMGMLAFKQTKSDPPSAALPARAPQGYSPAPVPPTAAVSAPSQAAAAPAASSRPLVGSVSAPSVAEPEPEPAAAASQTQVPAAGAAVTAETARDPLAGIKISGKGFVAKVKSATPGIWVVDPSKVKPYDTTTVSEALLNSSDGDVLQLRSGHYYENIVINRNVTITNVSGPVHIHSTVPFTVSNAKVSVFDVTLDLVQPPGAYISPAVIVLKSDLKLTGVTVETGHIYVDESRVDFSDLELKEKKMPAKGELKQGIVMYATKGSIEKIKIKNKEVGLMIAENSDIKLARISMESVRWGIHSSKSTFELGSSEMNGMGTGVLLDNSKGRINDLTCEQCETGVHVFQSKLELNHAKLLTTDLAVYCEQANLNLDDAKINSGRAGVYCADSLGVQSKVTAYRTSIFAPSYAWKLNRAEKYGAGNSPDL